MKRKWNWKKKGLVEWIFCGNIQILLSNTQGIDQNTHIYKICWYMRHLIIIILKLIKVRTFIFDNCKFRFGCMCLQMKAETLSIVGLGFAYFTYTHFKHTRNIQIMLICTMLYNPFAVSFSFSGVRSFRFLLYVFCIELSLHLRQWRKKKLVPSN